MEEDGGATWFSKSDLLNSSSRAVVSESKLKKPDGDLLGTYDRTLRDYSIKIDRQFGSGTFSSLTAYNEIEKFFEGDLDNSPLPLIQPASQELNLDAWTQELRFTSEDNQRLRYIVGGFFQKTNRDYEQIISGFDLGYYGFIPGVPAGQLSPFVVAFPPITTESEFEQSAVFAQVNYDLTDKLELSGALRYDRETREQTVVGSGRTDKETFEDWQPKFTVSYDLSDDLMIYGIYSHGFKSGGFNPPP